jgi:MFS transporter, FHS family, L-fucose permease
VIGLGLGTLETAANPYDNATCLFLTDRYIAICGPMEFSSIRLNLSQSFSGIGSIIGPLIASHTFFGSGNGDDLSSVQWVRREFSQC